MLDIYPKNAKILLVGPYPPPLGGISVHLQRLYKILIQNDYDATIYNTNGSIKTKMSRLKNYLTCLFSNKYDIVHVHGYRPAYFYITGFLKYAKLYDMYFTDHNSRLFSVLNKLEKRIYRFFIKRVSLLVLVNKPMFYNYKKEIRNLPRNILIRHAFLPPALSEEDGILRTYSHDDRDFLRTRRPLIVANASQIVFLDGIDLYGLDLCVELIHRLKIIFPNIGLLFALANSEINSEYLESLRRKSEYLGISENLQFMTGEKEVWPLFKVADLSVRPSTSDGDSISVRESLYFGCPVIASDAAKRPGDTIVFKSRDVEDFYEKVISILESKGKGYIVTR